MNSQENRDDLADLGYGGEDMDIDERDQDLNLNQDDQQV